MASSENLPVEVAPEEAESSGLNPAQILGMVRRKALLIGVAAIAVSAFLGLKSAGEVPLYEGRFSLLVEPVVQRKQISSRLAGDKGGGDTVKEFDYSTQIQVLLSPQALKPIVKQIQQRYPEVSVDEVAGKLSVIRLGETKILEVGYSGTDPAKVKFVLEELSQGYLRYSLEDQKATLRQGIQFIDQQLPTVRKRVGNYQRQIQRLRQTYNFMDPDAYAQQLASQITTIGQQRQAIRAEVATLQSRYGVLLQQEGAAAALSQSGPYQDFLKQFQALERQIAIESGRFGENSPTLRLLRQQQSNLEPLLRKEALRAIKNQQAAVFNEIQILGNRDRALGQAEVILSERFKQMPEVSRQFTDLQRSLKDATESMTRFQDTREALELQAAQNEVPWQLIAPPRDPASRAASNLYKSLMTGAIAGIAAGVVVAFLLEKLEDAFYSLPDLKKKSQLPLLGIIPYRPDLEHASAEVHAVDLSTLQGRSLSEEMTALKQRMRNLLERTTEGNSPTPMPQVAQADLSVEATDAYGFLESFRSLHANLVRLSANQPLRSLVISSALPSEGRTTVAVHLARAAAAMGRRVLLVDAHLRRGSVPLHTLLGLPETVGLGDLLQEQASLNQITQRWAGESSLFVVSAGSLPVDPTRLLASPQMHAFMERVHKLFDLVLYDTLPLMGLADVSLIAGHTDGVILVTGFGKRGGATALKQTGDRLKQARLPVLGVVANGVHNYAVDLYTR